MANASVVSLLLVKLVEGAGLLAGQGGRNGGLEGGREGEQEREREREGERARERESESESERVSCYGRRDMHRQKIVIFSALAHI